MRILLAAMLVAGCASAPDATRISAGPAIFRAVDVAGPEIDVAAFVRLTNSGAADDALVGVSCDCATRVEIHNTFDGDMHVLPSLDVPAGQATNVRPGGPTHLMLMGMKAPHANGETVRMTLTFRSGGRLAADFIGVGNSAEGWKAAGG
jgi:copper(I)-binding protein